MGVKRSRAPPKSAPLARLLFRPVMEVVTGLMEVKNSAVMRVETVGTTLGKTTSGWPRRTISADIFGKRSIQRTFPVRLCRACTLLLDLLFEDANFAPETTTNMRGVKLSNQCVNTRTLSDPTARLSADEQFATAEDGTSTSVSLKKQDSLDTSTASAATPNASTAGGPRKSYDSKSLPIRNDGSLDYDALYEDESDNDLSMESHGSVVTHLLSQVKIGMDLTKVVLPTFILERRSLLEMYADYFAHPDLFLRIADLNDPRERMVQVVRWYLSAYHAGRKSSVAKKPYNPILGEIFQCHWDTPDMPTGDDNSNIEVKEGPVPWCRKDQLTFIAEQVSHHPPISAFYAEHYNKKISFSAHVWTKSKFLGLSIGVHNIGQGTVTLCDLNEEYIVTFPNGYGRSILTVPWIELGGTVTITCPQTGYHADIDFLTKPFYGGKRNRIQGEIYSPNDKKSFLSITGEWSGLMEYKFNDGSKSSKLETFVDVNSIPIFKKQVRPVCEQSECESRKVWKEVTAGLKMNDIDKATNAKFLVEQKQREEARERKETSGEWANKYFKAVGDSWIYNNPLLHRLTLERLPRWRQNSQAKGEIFRLTPGEEHPGRSGTTTVVLLVDLGQNSCSGSLGKTVDSGAVGLFADAPALGTTNPYALFGKIVLQTIPRRPDHTRSWRVIVPDL
ncbi:oxysterol binding protein 9 [Culex quinquefasciatus]|uniref:Oxysterol-binding protein n=1 Tax=Culex quinquefasciatus TaxID=7176 RepID=B0VYY8_CULQU|nr:oxysterol binding protein 9 [Culex quinquefasciatus]|eukprot:XP_001841780.1 oxysterol binding protein 9 [Culex quinquefasciatus]